MERAAALHLYDPNVSHIDLGYRMKSQEANQLYNELTVRIHLKQKLTGDDFAAFAEKYPERVIDETTIGFPIDIPEASYGLHFFWPSAVAPPTIQRSARRFDVLRGGISISSAWSYGFGTLGGKVIDRVTGEIMLLSNWHVLAETWFARPGLAILQPGVGDGGTSRDVIAVYARHAMSMQLDAAVARIQGNRRFINEQLDLGAVTGAVEPALGMIIRKAGRRSEVTTGLVDGIAGIINQSYYGFTRTIRHVVHITQINGAGEISAPGDSGSLWLNRDTRQATALHFAGSNTPEFGLAIALPPVLDALQVDIATN